MSVGLRAQAIGVFLFAEEKKLVQSPSVGEEWRRKLKVWGGHRGLHPRDQSEDSRRPVASLHRPDLHWIKNRMESLHDLGEWSTLAELSTVASRRGAEYFLDEDDVFVDASASEEEELLMRRRRNRRTGEVDASASEEEHR